MWNFLLTYSSLWRGGAAAAYLAPSARRSVLVKRRRGNSLAAFYGWIQAFKQLPKDDDQREKNWSRDNESWATQSPQAEIKGKTKGEGGFERRRCSGLEAVNNPLRAFQQLALLVPFSFIVLSSQLRLSHFPLEPPCRLITTARTAPPRTCLQWAEFFLSSQC